MRSAPASRSTRPDRSRWPTPAPAPTALNSSSPTSSPTGWMGSTRSSARCATRNPSPSSTPSSRATRSSRSRSPRNSPPPSAKSETGTAHKTVTPSRSVSLLSTDYWLLPLRQHRRRARHDVVHALGHDLDQDRVDAHLERPASLDLLVQGGQVEALFLVAANRVGDVHQRH